MVKDVSALVGALCPGPLVCLTQCWVSVVAVRLMLYCKLVLEAKIIT